MAAERGVVGSPGEMAARTARFPWHRTPLGDQAGWPPELRAAVALMLESRHPMLIWWGPELTVLYNDAFAAVAGVKHPGGLGRPGREMFADVWSTIGPMLTGVLRTGEATWVVDQLLMMNRRGRDEETFWTYSYSPIRGADGAVTGVFTATSDTTARVLGERRLRVLRALGEVSAVAATGVEQACRTAAEVLVEGSADVVAAHVYLPTPDGAGVERVASHGPALSVPEDRVAQVARSGEPAEIDGRVFVLSAGTPGRSTVVLCLGLTPHREFDAEFRAFCELAGGQVASAVADARAYSDERTRGRKLAELDRAKTAFFSDVSHELRTPLTLILGPVQELRSATSPPDPERLRTELDVVHRNALRLRRLVDDLLDVSRLEAGRVEAAFEPVEAGGLTAELAGMFRSAVERAGLDYVVDCPPLPGPIHLDRELWEKVVFNLLSNALKHTFEGRITVALRPTADGGARLSVADTGVGIPAEELPRLFDRFHRVRGSRSRTVEGTGIGLALVRELVELHGGQVEVGSTPEVGTEFAVVLPAGHAHLPPEQVRPRAAAATGVAEPFLAEARLVADAAAPGDPHNGADAGARVLVVDDNTDMRDHLVRLLAPHYTVQAVGDGTTALAAARARPPDLVLSDVMMPGLDGLELVAALRADPRTAGVPTILLSARAGEEASVDGLAAGADGYLVKPFSAPELLARVGSQVTLSRLRRAEQELVRARAADERRARTVADAAAARLRAMVDGLSAVVWEADADTFAVTFVSERAGAMLGYPPERWTADPGFWPSIIHPDDREEAVARCAAQTAAGRDHDLAYRAHTADGRVVWIHDLVHVICDEGEPRRLQGVMIDVTAQKRAEQSAELLAEAGRLLGGPDELAEQLTALARLTTGPMGDCTIVSLPVDDEARYRPVAVAHVDPRYEPLLAQAAHAQAPEGLRAAVERGEPFVVGDITDDVRTEDRPAPDVRDARERLGSRAALVVPLTLRGQVLGLLTFATTDATRRYDDADLAFGRQLGGRVAAALEAHRLRDRARLLQEATSELAAAASTVTAAEAVARAAQRGLRATYVGLYRLGIDRRLHSVLRHGYPDDVDLGAYASLALDVGTPVTDAVRAGRPLWVSDPEELGRRYPDQAPVAASIGTRALAVLPLRLAGAVTGALTLSFDRPRVFRPADREFAELLATQAAQTFERTVVADERRRIAETLQLSLLPPEPPALPRLAIARRYLPGAEYTQAGGDWYDVLDLDDGRVAVAVGDVVGQGAAAAAVMGQLRSALAAHLLDGDPPAEALRKLDRFSHRVPGSRASTAACLVLDTRDGTLRWARAGHLPPLVLGPDGARYLDDAHGCVLGIPHAPPCTEGTAVLAPGSTVLLYTDGLVERRDETIDDGLARLAAIAGRHADVPPEELASAVVRAALDERGPPDDVALIVARLRPPPLEARIPARASELAGMRAGVREWAALAALTREQTEHVQLALGEAVANAVEHAYTGRGPGVVDYCLELVAGGGVRVEVRDGGHWSGPEDRRPGGHGLAVIQGLAPDAVVDAAPDGTRVRFTVPA